jgi:hypothetical protein
MRRPNFKLNVCPFPRLGYKNQTLQTLGLQQPSGEGTPLQKMSSLSRKRLAGHILWHAKSQLGANASFALSTVASGPVDYYRVLGVSRTASAEEIKAGFREAAKRYHPDVHGDATLELFKKVNEAYSVLSEECACSHRSLHRDWL